jgi:hypothetical protein
MSRIRWIFILLALLFVAPPLMAADFAFHGDMNHRFMLYSNHLDWFKGQRPEALHDGNVEDSYADIKYRLWTEAATNDGKVKGVYAIEMGGLRYGASGSLGKGTGGTYSGDSVNIETRWAYVDFQVPGVTNKSRIKIGLQPYKLNSRLWNQTILAVKYTEKIGFLNYQLAWLRPHDVLNPKNEELNTDDIDFLSARYDVNLFNNDFKAALFGLYGFNDDAGDKGPTAEEPGLILSSKYQVKKFPRETGLRLWCVGTDGSISMPMALPLLGDVKLFSSWDTIFQFGKIKNAIFYDNVINPETNIKTIIVQDKEGKDKTIQYHSEGDFDIFAFTSHFKAGLEMGPAKLTYTGWYTSGDRDATDHKLNGYMAIDMDADDSIVLFEGNYADDVIFTNAHYLLNKGFIMNKLAMDYQLTDILKVGFAGLYMRTAKSMTYHHPDVKDLYYSVRNIGYEADTYAKIKLYPNLEFAINGGYLFSGNAMDVFEEKDIRNGVADEDIYIITSRVRYKF